MDTSKQARWARCDVMAWVAVEPDVHTHVALGRSQHAVAALTDPQDVAGPLQCGKVACLVLNPHVAP